ncbi:glycosyltransferase [Sphingomonas sp. LB3N6]|uniref:glycosyltransferase n=1 Tax=Sphingomonas fucosidasi TaxID=3096164 RepID=UPI002FC86767
MAAPLTARRSVIVISDFVDGQHPGHDRPSPAPLPAHATDPASYPWIGDLAPVDVTGGYLERLPLALVAAGIVDQAEIWHHWRSDDEPPFRKDNAVLVRRAFRIDDEHPRFTSSQMNAFVETFGAPHILVVLGLGVAPDLLALCANSIILYNSIDAPSLRVPPDVSEHFDLVITGAQWQSDEVEARHPGMRTAILPVGPEFAAIDQFRPLGTPKDVDLIYVAAAQPYKRHDILFDSLAQLPRDVRAICVFGYGEDADALRERARDQALSIEFVGPPGVPIDEVNRLMNRARFGVVCGIDDGAPAILTEYMLAGLPVLANAGLRCGLQFILPETGMTASTTGFADAILTMRETYADFRPRDAVLACWTWTHSVVRLAVIIQQIHDAKQLHLHSQV